MQTGASRGRPAGGDGGDVGGGAGLQSRAIFTGHIRERLERSQRDLKRQTPNEYESLTEKTSLSAMILPVTDEETSGEVNCAS